jgi:hypothetical protein
MREPLAGLRRQDRVDVAGPLGVVEVAALRGPRLHRVGELVELALYRVLHRRVHQHPDPEHHELAVELAEGTAVLGRPREGAAKVAQLREQQR